MKLIGLYVFTEFSHRLRIAGKWNDGEHDRNSCNTGTFLSSIPFNDLLSRRGRWGHL